MPGKAAYRSKEPPEVGVPQVVRASAVSNAPVKMSRSRSFQLRRLVCATTLFAIGMVAFAMADDAAAARGIKLEIATPRANAQVGSHVNVKIRLKSAPTRHAVRYYVDGKLVSAAHVGTKSKQGHLVRLKTPGVAGGRHRIRVVVIAGKRRAAKSVTVFVVGTPQLASDSSAGQQSAYDPEGVAFPKNDVQDFKLIFADDFIKPAALGTMGSESDANKIVYIGATGTKWQTYPGTFSDTLQGRPYRSDRVLSVHSGYLDFWLHNVDGVPAGANPSPVLPDGTQYQTYGRYSARVKVDTDDLSDYKTAWLLWPKDDASWESAESDFPEVTLRAGLTGVWAHAHYGPGNFETGRDLSVDMHDWHIYTQEWTPFVRRYYVDDRLIFTTVKPVWEGPQRWQLQTETIGNGVDSGHLLVNWVAVYSYKPGLSAASESLR